MSKNKIKPRILIVGPVPPPYGGIAISIKNLLNSNLSLYFKMKQLSNSPNRPVKYSGKIDILNINSYFQLILNYIKEVIKFKPNIIQIESSSGISFLKNSTLVLLKFISNAKIILSIHGSGSRFLHFYDGVPLLLKNYIKYVLLKCDAIRLLSNKWMQPFIMKFKLNYKNIFSIPNGIETSFINRKQNKLDFGNNIIILYLGWIGKKKGTFDLLTVTEILKEKAYNFKILLVGPEMKEGNRKLINDTIRNKGLKNNIKLFKEVKYDKVYLFYNSADIFILPSYTEGFPLCILEAMASGLPIVSTNVGAIPEVVEEGKNGFLFEPGDIDTIISKIEFLINNKNLRDEIRHNNIEKVKNEFSVDRQVNKFKNLYINLLKF
jgi:glycosyltransferase involved in cell wall biosynthesis